MLHCTSTSRTDVGMVRQHNEDACLDRPDLGLWVVADGMGGHAAGDLASGLIVERLGEIAAEELLSRFVDEVEATLESVNAELRELAVSRDASTIGSTVAALLVRGRHAVCAWAGDSRVYRIRAGSLIQISQDHALVADLVDRGVLTPEQAANHPHSNLVTRAVGAGESFKLDLEIVEIRAGDRFILCSDGLDKEVADQEILDMVTVKEPRNVAEALVDLALSRGSRDNVTVISVHVHGPGETPRNDEDDPEDTLPGFTAGGRHGFGEAG